MTDSQHIAATIPQLLGGHHSVRITSEGYMALCVETIGSSPDGTPLISLAHYEEKTRKGILRTIATMQHLRFNSLRSS